MFDFGEQIGLKLGAFVGALSFEEVVEAVVVFVFGMSQVEVGMLLLLGLGVELIDLLLQLIYLFAEFLNVTGVLLLEGIPFSSEFDDLLGEDGEDLVKL